MDPDDKPGPFLGRSVAYWLELERRFESEGGTRAPALLAEILQLRGKIATYEARIKEMHNIATGNY